MSKYCSITTPTIQHDVPNILTELIYLNQHGNTGQFPWRTEAKKFWMKTVSVVKKIMRDFDIDANQMAFYIYKCRPKSLDHAEFAKATFVPKILFKRFNLDELVSLYRDTYTMQTTVLANTNYERKQEVKPKSLLELMKELENETKSK